MLLVYQQKRKNGSRAKQIAAKSGRFRAPLMAEAEVFTPEAKAGVLSAGRLSFVGGEVWGDCSWVTGDSSVLGTQTQLCPLPF